MTDSAVLNTVLGLVFLFYALALLCSGLVEMIANWVKKRAKYLLRGIRDLIDDVGHADVADGGRCGADAGRHRGRRWRAAEFAPAAAVAFQHPQKCEG